MNSTRSTEIYARKHKSDRLLGNREFMELNKGRCIKVKKGDALAQFNLSPEERAQVFPDHKENFELLELTLDSAVFLT